MTTQWTGLPLSSATTTSATDVLTEDGVNLRVGIHKANPARTLDVGKEGAGIPQLRLTGTDTRYAELRAGSDGSDDGDFYITQTGSTVWLQSIITNNRLTLDLVPKGTPPSISPTSFEMFGTDFTADGTNYERLRLTTKGTADISHLLTSEAGGTGTVRSLAINAGSNHIWLDAPTGRIGLGTVTPSAQVEVLANGTQTQLRLSYDADTYYDFAVSADNTLTLTPADANASININGKTRIIGMFKIESALTSALPAGDPQYDNRLILEDTGAAVNLVAYLHGQRFRFTGTAF